MTPLPDRPNTAMAITKAELTDTLVNRLGLNQREAKEMVEAFFDEICTCLTAGNEVKLSGFGQFAVRDKPERPGRNPKTKAPATISARRVVTFRPSGLLRARVAVA